jgi:hypothetical protein
MSDEQQAARLWWPIEWADEVMPPGRDCPAAFLQNVDGKFILGYPLDDAAVSETDRRHHCQELKFGAVVKFFFCDDHGEVTLEIHSDCSFTVVAGAASDGATHFHEPGNSDTLASSILEFVQNHVEPERESSSARWPQTVQVRMAYWSDEVAYKLMPVGFDLAKGQLEPVSAGGLAQ